jgi:hypothetical protein
MDQSQKRGNDDEKTLELKRVYETIQMIYNGSMSAGDGSFYTRTAVCSLETVQYTPSN